MQTRPERDLGAGEKFLPLMDKSEIPFIFQPFPSSAGEKPPKPAQLKTRKSLLCLENSK